MQKMYHEVLCCLLPRPSSEKKYIGNVNCTEKTNSDRYNSLIAEAKLRCMTEKDKDKKNKEIP